VTGIAALGSRVASRRAIIVLLVAAAATIGGAYLFEYGWGFAPCKLCLTQRKPYYISLAFAAGALLLPGERARRGALAVLALVFLVGAGLGAYHAGAEWGFWPGPSDCGGGTATSADIGGFLHSLETTRVVNCTEAAWRFLGLSLAGWNVLISLSLSAYAAWAARHGSSSVSQ
jgi:disulfide bond formation protein DsbB